MKDDVTSITLDASLAEAGPAAASFKRLWNSLWGQEHIPGELLELCRLTLARLHGDSVELATSNPNIVTGGISTTAREAVVTGDSFDSDALSDAEKAVLLFTEYYWTDTQSITDEAAEGVISHFGEPGLVFLIEALGCIDGRIRVSRCLRDLANFNAKETAHVG